MTTLADPKEAAAMLGVSVWTLRRYLRQPAMRAKLGAKKISPKRWRFVREHLDRYASSMAN